MSGSGTRPVPEVRPRDVPGFERFRQLGLVPRVPAEPPALLPGRTAGQEAGWFFAKIIGAGIGLVVAVEILQRLGLPSSVWGLLMLGFGLGTMWYVFRSWRLVGERNLAEFARGYTTLKLTFGVFQFGTGRFWRGSGHQAPWDYSGVWVIDIAGRQVMSAPDLTVEPPGHYPSPNREGWLELWTGMVWIGDYRKGLDAD